MADENQQDTQTGAQGADTAAGGEGTPAVASGAATPESAGDNKPSATEPYTGTTDEELAAFNAKMTQVYAMAATDIRSGAKTLDYSVNGIASHYVIDKAVVQAALEAEIATQSLKAKDPATDDAVQLNAADTSGPQVIDNIAAHGAADTVTMTPPETGAANPQTVSSTDPLVPTATYATGIGTEIEVELHHVRELIAHGWTVVRDDIEGGWEAALDKFHAIKAEIESLPAWFHNLTISQVKDKIEAWFNEPI